MTIAVRNVGESFHIAYIDFGYMLLQNRSSKLDPIMILLNMIGPFYREATRLQVGERLYGSHRLIPFWE